MTATEVEPGCAGLQEALAAFVRQEPVPGATLKAYVRRAGAEIAWPPAAAPLPLEIRSRAELALVTGSPISSRAGRSSWMARAVDTPYPLLIVLSAEEAPGPRVLAEAVDRLAAILPARVMPAEIAAEPFLPVVAASPSLAGVAATLRRVAPTRLPVLLLGETGTGKELLARALHAASGRTGAFVAENCAALPESLLEAELFGVRRGAFTGAEADRRGRLLDADRGTLMLDEVGDLPPALQAKLLRVLQDHEVRALGADRPRAVDLRVVSATHRDLVTCSAAEFRRDLFYRIAGVVVRVPPLAERVQDLPYLAAALLARAAADALGPGRHLSPAGLAVLASSVFPGNVRELDNILRRAAAPSPGPRIPAELLGPAAPPAAEDRTENLEVRAIVDALARARGVKAGAARALGWTRQKLYRRLVALGLPHGPTRRPPR